VEQFPAIITALDPNRPIYDKANLYIDAFINYRTRLFSAKVAASFSVECPQHHRGWPAAADQRLSRWQPQSVPDRGPPAVHFPRVV
jgi:hypothetical protein